MITDEKRAWAPEGYECVGVWEESLRYGRGVRRKDRQHQESGKRRRKILKSGLGRRKRKKKKKKGIMGSGSIGRDKSPCVWWVLFPHYFGTDVV